MYSQFLDKHLFTFLDDVQVSQASGHFLLFPWWSKDTWWRATTHIMNFNILNTWSFDYYTCVCCFRSSLINGTFIYAGSCFRSCSVGWILHVPSVRLIVDVTNRLGYPFLFCSLVVNFIEACCDCASVERVMALLISPIRVPLFRDNGPWLCQGVKHWLCIGLMYSVDEKELFSGCKVTMVSKNGRRLLSGVSMVNFKAEFRLLAVESTDSGVMWSDYQATNMLSKGSLRPG